jgi:sn-glycerol 3-phosphate transport system permease protein
MITDTPQPKTMPQVTVRVPRPPLTLGRALSYLALVAVVAAIGLPLYWMLLASFKTNADIYRFPPSWLPLNPILTNYPDAWNAAPFARYYVNSLFTTLVAAGAKVFFAVTSAYALAFLRFPRKDLVFLLVIGALMVPAQVTIVPNYQTVAALGWIDTYAGIIIPNAATAFGTFLMRQYYLTLPRETLEAAEVDGASHLRRLWSIVLPMARPALATTLLFAVVSEWNEFLWPLVVTNTEEMRTLPIGMLRLFEQEGLSAWGVVMAGTVFVIAPVVLLFIWAQRHIVDGLAAGAVKG